MQLVLSWQILWALVWFPAVLGTQASNLPEELSKLVTLHCLDCHDAETRKGNIHLQTRDLNWEAPETFALWEQAIQAVRKGRMPPPEKSELHGAHREKWVSGLDRLLLEHGKRGGTGPRRLNRDEYQSSIRSLFRMEFELPPGFPPDTEEHGFDNVGEALVLSPPLMAAYSETADAVADTVFPPSRSLPPSRVYEVPASEMVISYSSGSVRDGAMRLAIGDPPLSRGCTWPGKVEVPASGRYRIQVEASQFSPGEESPMHLQVLARDVSQDDSERADGLRVLQSLVITEEAPRVFEFEADLYEGQTIVFFWKDAPLTGDKKELEAYLRGRFLKDPRWLAAWQQVEHGSGLRGGLGWDRVKALMDDPGLDLSHASLEDPKTQEILKTMLKNPVLYYETIAFDHYDHGPALEIHHARIEGPLARVEDPRDLKRKAIQARLLGKRGERTDEAWTRDILKGFLTRAFRRPVEESTLRGFVELVDHHRAAGHDLESGIHQAIRTALISPRFLYRSWSPGLLDDFGIASRLSYFLTGGPPDDRLMRLAQQGSLSQSAILQEEALRLLPGKPEDALVKRFTGQWLDLRSLDELMPDPRLKLSAAEQADARQESEMFFLTLLKENRPMEDFLDPDFTFASGPLAANVYRLKEGFNRKDKKMQRIRLERGTPVGGLLGQAAVMMATANGVDTQPVVRGAWVLENLMGDPVPPPPQAVPAITPDTTGARTPRELLLAHASDKSCAMCHRRMDPIGFALENLDAVGRWRENYVRWEVDDRGRNVAQPGAAIDSSGNLPDGTPIRDVKDLKQWLVEHVEDFSCCVSEKLMTYATGRVPTYAERREIADLVEVNRQAKGGFRDLLIALIQSRTFREN